MMCCEVRAAENNIMHEKQKLNTPTKRWVLRNDDGRRRTHETAPNIDSLDRHPGRCDPKSTWNSNI
jgi:hypothetical protein